MYFLSSLLGSSATADYIGTNTRQEKAVSVGENDDTVKFIKKGM